MDSKPRPTFSVVIPVHNEADYVPGALAELFEELSTVPVDIEVLVVENGSDDDTVSEIKALISRYPGLSWVSLPTPDYGAAMREGFLATNGDWAVNFDIDYFSGDFLSTVLHVGSGADIVLASKRAVGADDRRSPFRRFATWTFNQILQFGLGSEVSDTHGMKAVRRSVVSDVVPRVKSTQDLFDTELVVRAERAGYRIIEVPAVCEEKREAKTSLMTRVPRTLRGIAEIRRNL
jgi:glycosyltransferase involved in cell wall biosynthesis